MVVHKVDMGGGRDDDLIIGLDGALLELQRKFEAAPSFIDADASWGRMLVTQPSIRQLRMMTCKTTYNRERDISSIGTQTRRKWGVLDFSHTVSSGLTMGYLYDQVLREITDGGHDFGKFWRTYSRKELVRNSRIPWDDYEEFRGELLPCYLINLHDQPVLLQRIDLDYAACRNIHRKKIKMGLKGFMNKAHEILHQGKYRICVDDKKKFLFSLCDTLVGHVKWDCYEEDPSCGKWVTDTDQRSPSEIRSDSKAVVWTFQE